MTKYTLRTPAPLPEGTEPVPLTADMPLEIVSLALPTPSEIVAMIDRDAIKASELRLSDLITARQRADNAVAEANNALAGYAHESKLAIENCTDPERIASLIDETRAHMNALTDRYERAVAVRDATARALSKHQQNDMPRIKREASAKAAKHAMRAREEIGRQVTVALESLSNLASRMAAYEQALGNCSMQLGYAQAHDVFGPVPAKDLERLPRNYEQVVSANALLASLNVEIADYTSEPEAE